MKRIPKQVITCFLTLVLMLSLCACAQNWKLGTGSDEAESGADEDPLSGMTDKKKPGKPSGETDIAPVQAEFSREAEQSLIWLRDRIDFPQTMFGAAYLGYVEEDLGGDWLSAADQAMPEAYPFLAEIDKNHIIGSAGHLYCIVPVDENASVAINRMQWNEKTNTYENTEVCYRSESGEPVLLFANLDGVAYECDTQVWITDSSGNSCQWWPSLDGMSYLVPCTSEAGDYLSFDFTEYGWRGAPSELTPWLADGWSGIYAPGLEGCWTVQAAAWDTNRTANYYLWFFPEDENGGSVDLDWQYEGSDLFEEMHIRHGWAQLCDHQSVPCGWRKLWRYRRPVLYLGYISPCDQPQRRGDGDRRGGKRCQSAVYVQVRRAALYADTGQLAYRKPGLVILRRFQATLALFRQGSLQYPHGKEAFRCQHR